MEELLLKRINKEAYLNNGIDAAQRRVDPDNIAHRHPADPHRGTDADPARLAELEHGLVLPEPRPQLEPAAEPRQREREERRAGHHEQPNAALPHTALAEPVVPRRPPPERLDERGERVLAVATIGR